ncbi:hypothetical protein I5I01_gp55 [Mycobacterium phage MooMoo]|uniref:Uncharacterized protein n=1 Tax=Mycobacterium phage MooMoo TaxID=2108127 RepID=A0A2P1JR99_9CAUD|nr:hypothetical protein I5I01_gp55 [Mycobacterium phage MooMoo]AVO21660.1 hypothetical protein SEA_MOOMOO_55 [Mycobacterium phage MooMoo]
MTATVTPIKAGHITDVVASFSPYFGRTWKPVCSCGTYRGCHYPNPVRARAAANEHVNRHTGKKVTQK